MPKANFPPNVVIQCNEKEWMSQEIILERLYDVWRKRKDSFFKPSRVLIIDSMTAHLMDPVKALHKIISLYCYNSRYLKKNFATPWSIYQWIKSFKSKVRKQWEKWTVEELHSYTKPGKKHRATYKEVAMCVPSTWKGISPKTIISRFEAANNLVQQYRFI